MIELLDNPEQDEQTELNQGRTRIRDDFQKARDTEIRALAEAWLTAGKPEPTEDADKGVLVPNPDSPFRRYTVKGDDKTAFKRVITRAANYTKLTEDGTKLRDEGSKEGDAVGLAWYTDQANKNGTYTLKVSVMTAKKKEASETPAAPAATPDASADAGAQGDAPAPKPGPPAKGGAAKGSGSK